MDPLFRHTFRSMSDDGGLRAGPIGLIAVVAMGAGLIWSLTAQVDVRAVSQRAALRVEADGRDHEGCARVARPGARAASVAEFRRRLERDWVAADAD